MSQGGLLGLSRVAGGVAGLVGLALAELGAGLIARDGSPVADVATVLAWPLSDYWSSGTGKVVLMSIVTAAWLVLSVIAGQLELRRRHFSLFVIIPVAVVTLLAVSTQVGPGALGYVPAVVGLAAVYLTLRLLIAELRRPPGALEPLVAERRSFLKTAGLITLGGIIVAGAGRILIQASNKVAEVRTKILLPTPATPAPTIAPGTDLKNVAGLTPYLNTNDSFYRIDTALQLPTIDPDTWTLKVTGLVEHELTLTYAQLLARPLTEHVTTLSCMSNQVGGALVGNAIWLGLPVRDLLAEAVPQTGATTVVSTSEDGWTAATPLSVLTDSDLTALLAVGMNGHPLPPEHGFPVRMVVPGLYGDVSATKWVTQLKVTTSEASGYWARKGWASRGPVKIASRIDVPARSVVEPGTVTVAGMAWAPPTGISAVHVQVNDGAWRKAKLAETTGPDTWRQWAYQWKVTEPGDYTLTVRATDADGRIQTSKVAPPFPSGASGLHTVSVKVRTS